MQGMVREAEDTRQRPCLSGAYRLSRQPNWPAEEDSLTPAGSLSLSLMLPQPSSLQPWSLGLGGWGRSLHEEGRGESKGRGHKKPVRGETARCCPVELSADMEGMLSSCTVRYGSHNGAFEMWLMGRKNGVFNIMSFRLI